MLDSGPFADDFFPFSLIRSVADIRCGILTIREKWNLFQKKNPGIPHSFPIPANIIPNDEAIEILSRPNPDIAELPATRLSFSTMHLKSGMIFI